MRILYINHYAGSPFHGMEYRPFYLARHWIALGHEVLIVAASQSHVRTKQPQVSSEPVNEVVDGVRYRWLPTSGYAGNGVRRLLNMLSFVWALYRNKKYFVEDFKPDVVIASSTYPWDIFPAQAIAKKAKAKLVFEVHDLWPLSPMELGGMSKWHPFIMALQFGEDFACKYSDLVVSILPRADLHLIQRGMSLTKYVHIPNGIELSEWESDNAPVPKQQQELLGNLRSSGHFIVGYAGAHGLANALEHFVLAAKVLANTRTVLVLVGGGPEKKTLQQLVITEGLKNVFFLDPIPKKAIPAFLNECDALYIGLQRQPLFKSFGISPNKLMDYMAAGKPIVQSIDAANDVVNDAKCGISVHAEDANLIALAIGELMALSSTERSAMGAAGQKYVRDNFDYRALAQHFLSVVN